MSSNHNVAVRFDARAAAAIILGNTLAWADFALYAYFSPVLSHVFFPFTSKANAYILYFIVFAIGFLFRPIGSVWAGAFADRHGRKNTLLITVIVSSVVTALIGCLPDYDSIGFFSPMLLTLLRIAQTMAVSAEPTNSASLLTESAAPQHKGLVASCVMVGVFLGFLLGIASFLLITYYLDLEDINAWGWRLPFLFSLLIGAVVAKFLYDTPESPLFLLKRAEGKLTKNPLKSSFEKYSMMMFIGFGYAIMMAITNYFLLGFMPDFLTNTLKITLKASNLFITISVLVSVILIPVMGYISDIIGRKPVMAIGAAGFIVFTYPMMLMISTGNMALILLALVGYGVLLAPVSAVLPVALSEMFPFAVRCTASTIGYNAALVIFGGTTPIIAELLVHYTHSLTSPFWYISSLACVHLLFVLLSKETKNNDIRI